MIGSIGVIIVNFVIGLVNIIMIPLDLIVDSFIPGVSSMLNYITDMFNYAIGPITIYIFDALLIPHSVIVILCEYLIVKYSLPVAITGIKYALVWYHNLRI